MPDVHQGVVRLFRSFFKIVVVVAWLQPNSHDFGQDCKTV
jgi:hypothetical protein